jgi:predicted DNA-binding protein
MMLLQKPQRKYLGKSLKNTLEHHIQQIEDIHLAYHVPLLNKDIKLHSEAGK